MRLRDQVPRLRRKVRVHVLAEAARQQLGERCENEHEGDDTRDGARSVSHQRADGEREQPEDGKVEAAADHRSQYSGVAE